MPGFDRTGPQGQGARTGRGMGYCAPTGSEVSQEPIYGVGRGGVPRGGGRGFTFGGRRGRGFRHGMWMSVPPVNMTKAQEIAVLQEHASLLQEELKQLNARIEELSAEADQK